MAMQYQNTESTLLSSRDGFELFWQKWVPRTDTRTVIVFMHGLGDHSGRYQKLLTAFENESTTFYALDARGHGRTVGKRGYAESFQVFADDLGDLVQIARNENPEAPLYLMCHSSGGLMGLKYTLTDSQQYNLDGLMLSSPPIKMLLTPAQKLLKVIGQFLAPVFPRTTVKVNLDPSYFTRSPELIEAYKTDPLILDRMSLSIGKDLFDTSRQVLQEAGNIKIPVYIWHGLEDSLCSAEGAQELYEELGTTNKNIHFYDDLLHDTINESGEFTWQLFSDMKSWLKEQSAGAQGNLQKLQPIQTQK